MSFAARLVMLKVGATQQRSTKWLEVHTLVIHERAAWVNESVADLCQQTPHLMSKLCEPR